LAAGTCAATARQIGRMTMAKKTSRGRKQDRARVADKQDYEVRFEAKKTGTSKAKVKRAVNKAGPSRKRVERALGNDPGEM
jgi:hypothetical protein